ncbi:hypothetical protein D3C86_2170140 [compost metagenome]
MTVAVTLLLVVAQLAAGFLHEGCFLRFERIGIQVQIKLSYRLGAGIFPGYGLRAMKGFLLRVQGNGNVVLNQPVA